MEPIPPLRSSDLAWPFWPLVPLYPYGHRRTLRREIVTGQIWTFDQVQGILYVIVPIRMIVVRLQQGGLLVYAPVAPTVECLRLMQELIEDHGEVKYIIHPTASGLEHKVFVGPFAREYPRAQVFVAPDQWSFPVNLPLSWLGFPPGRTQALSTDPAQVPFSDEFDYAILGPIPLKRGSFQEVALFHRSTSTLLLTDSLLAIPMDPPVILDEDPYPLLFHAREQGTDSVEDTPENRHKGWARICLFAMYFRPGALEVVETAQVIGDAFKASDRSKQAYFGLYPFKWRADWWDSFKALQGEGRPLVAPVLQTLIFRRGPQQVIHWVKQVASWGFDRIITCHFDCPLSCSVEQFQTAYAFLDPDLALAPSQPLVQIDLDFMEQLDRTLTRRQIIPPRQPTQG